MDDLIACRSSREADGPALAALFRETWANAYAGIIPGPALARMLGRRGPSWWAAAGKARDRALVIDMGEGPVGYVLFGPSRRPAPRTGEIYELYLRPDCQGVGFGRRLFEAARGRLADGGRSRLVVWALEENTLACRFYRAMGGGDLGRSYEAIGGRRIPKVGFVWT